MAAIRVGVVGANPAAGWARGAHMPALQALPQFELAAVATRRRESAEAAAAAWGARTAYDDPLQLIASPDVDLVVVSVRAPWHFEIAAAALAHRKHLLCEWPVGSNLAQTQALADQAQAAGVRAFVGLQGRAAPPVVHARDLVREGHVGRLISASVYAAFSTWGNPVSSAYGADVTAGANVLTIAGGHGLDVAVFIAGEPVTAIVGVESHLRTEVMAADIGRTTPFTAPDQFACAGVFASGAVLSAHVVGAAPRGLVYQLRLVGEAGELVVEGDGMPEVLPLRLSGTCDRAAPAAPIPVPPSCYQVAGVEGPALNVAHLYRLIAQDIATGGRTAPDLASALPTRALLDAIQRSAAGAGRISLA